MSFRDVGRSHLTSRNRVAPAPLSVSNSANRELSPSPPPEKVVSTPTRRRSEARQQPEPCPASPIDQIAAALQLHDRERSYRSERKLIQQSTTVPRYDIAKSLRMSAFSRLNDEIVQFQKLVNDLQEIVDTDVLTPEDQWRTRILLKSTADADSQLFVEIRDSPWNKQKGLAVKASFSKLKRDFERVRGCYSETVGKYHAKQRAETSLLSSQIEESLAAGTPQRSKRVVQEEDFFDREMRMREAESEQINTSMRKVNAIYDDLGKLVNDQQEKIDYIEDQFRLSRANVEVGVEHLQQSNRNRIMSCSSDSEVHPRMMCGLHQVPGSPRSVVDRSRSPLLIPSDENFHWTLPFKTFGPDMLEVRNDLLDLGYIGANKITTKLVKLKKGEVFQCGSASTDDDFSIVTGKDSSY